MRENDKTIVNYVTELNVINLNVKNITFLYKQFHLNILILVL